MAGNESDAAEREFDALMERHGIVVPPDRRAGTLAGVRDLQRLAALLRQPRPAESEPAAVYRLETVVRGAVRQP